MLFRLFVKLWTYPHDLGSFVDLNLFALPLIKL